MLDLSLQQLLLMLKGNENGCKAVFECLRLCFAINIVCKYRNIFRYNLAECLLPARYASGEGKFFILGRFFIHEIIAEEIEQKNSCKQDDGNTYKFTEWAFHGSTKDSSL